MIPGLGIYEFRLLVKDMAPLPTTGLRTTEVIDELEGLVQELKKPHTHKDVMTHLNQINQKIDLIRESVQRLCESTANCVETTSYE